MKIYYFVTIAFVCSYLIACDKNKSTHEIVKISDVELTELQFDNKILDIGDVAMDTIVNVEYKFKNTGSANLKIEYVNPDCTCTGYAFTRNEIFPGEYGYVNLSFNTRDKFGIQELYAVVKANTSVKFYRLKLKLNINSIEENI